MATKKYVLEFDSFAELQQVAIGLKKEQTRQMVEAVMIVSEKYGTAYKVGERDNREDALFKVVDTEGKAVVWINVDLMPRGQNAKMLSEEISALLKLDEILEPFKRKEV